MTLRLVPSRLAAVTLLLACDGGAVTGPPIQSVVVNGGWSVSALTPRLSLTGTEVQGAMKFSRASGVSTRGGGVCLVADLHGNQTCSSAADCVALPMPAGGFHYCAGINSDAAKRCWTRPGAAPDYCNRGTDRVGGEYSTPAVPARVNGAPTLWLSYACLANADNPGGCGSGSPANYVFATSPVLDIAR